MKVMYPSRKGGKSLNIGMNRAKQVAIAADRRDRLAVLKKLGSGLPRQHWHHQQLVNQRHAYYGDVYDELRSHTQPTADPSSVGQEDRGPVGEVSDDPAGRNAG
jgi:hypothetical protein